MLKLYYGYARITVSVLGVAIGAYTLICFEIFPKCRTECTRALTVDYTHRGYRGKYGIVKIFINNEPGIVTYHSAHVYLNAELRHNGTLYLTLRGGAALVIAGLVAEGKTEITNISTIERGYLDIVGKLRDLGADIEKIYIDENAFA